MSNPSTHTYYVARVLDMTVHMWTDEGQGDHFCNKGGYTLGRYDTLDEAKQGINDHFEHEVTSEDYTEDGYIQTSQIEDANAYRDPDGDFIVDYYMCIDRVTRVTGAELTSN